MAAALGFQEHLSVFAPGPSLQAAGEGLTSRLQRTLLFKVGFDKRNMATSQKDGGSPPTLGRTSALPTTQASWRGQEQGLAWAQTWAASQTESRFLLFPAAQCGVPAVTATGHWARAGVQAHQPPTQYRTTPAGTRGRVTRTQVTSLTKSVGSDW
ncbi:uncharacterized protein LOC144375942 [Ictidomys tridecemlineatus]